jgi:hypothetical protein
VCDLLETFYDVQQDRRQSHCIRNHWLHQYDAAPDPQQRIFSFVNLRLHVYGYVNMNLSLNPYLVIGWNFLNFREMDVEHVFCYTVKGSRSKVSFDSQNDK